MRALIIDDDVKGRIDALKRHAKAHPVPLARLHRMAAGLEPPVGDDSPYVIWIPGGFRVVFSIKEQPTVGGWSRHLSISVTQRGKYPNLATVNEIALQFGFTDKPRRTWFEKAVEAVNVVQPVGGEPTTDA